MSNKLYILGGGINGIIVAFYNRNYQIIADKIGGQNNNNFPLGPRYIHVTKKTKQLMKDLYLDVKIKRAKIGYIDAGQISNVAYKGYKDKYFSETRGTSHLYSSALNNDKDGFLYYDISFNDLMKYMLPHIKKPLLANVIHVDYKSKFLFTNKTFGSFDNLISTLPLKKLLNLINEDASNLRTLDKIFILTDNFNYYDDEFDFIYCINRLYNRVTKFEDKHVIEFTGIDEDKVMQYCNDNNIAILRKVILKDVQICNVIKIRNCFRDSNDYLNFTSNIKLIGRNANFNHSLKVEDVIKQANER